MSEHSRVNKSIIWTRGVVGRLFLAAALSSFVCMGAMGQQLPGGPLNNAAVVKLVKAGFKEKTIISIINSRPNRFNVETEQLIQLKHNGVSENIILAMLSLGEPPVGDEDWADESFFRGSNKPVEGDPKESTESGGTDIFGSSAGSSSRTQSRGNRGGNENEGNVTGSATVRIIRPPSESGNSGPAKLEKTPTLDNEAVIKLVEAGFSEGTIIKRIEDSPVEFDLAKEKLEQLRKRRVTDPIINAMAAAMSDGSAKPE